MKKRQAMTKKAVQKRTMGATRTRARSKTPSFSFRWLLLMGSGFFGATIIVAIFFWLEKSQPFDWVSRYFNRPIVAVNIESSFQYLNRNASESLIEPHLTETFIDLNIKQLKASVEAHSWVDQAIVRRQWPDTLIIKIIEQKPIARWGGQEYLSQKGEVFTHESYVDLSHLPMLQASKKYTERVLKHYLVMSKMLLDYDLKASTIVMDDALSWLLNFDNGIELKVGKDHVLNKLKRFIGVYDMMKIDEQAKIKAVDMRYSNGFAVAWHSPRRAVVTTD